MRPDEHKKKQRAQYKKKHGISEKKTTSKEKKETNEGKESTESQGNVDLAETDGVMNCVLNCKIMSAIFDNLLLLSALVLIYIFMFVVEIRGSSQGEISQATGIGMKTLSKVS